MEAGKFTDVYSSKVTKNEDERMSYTLLVCWELTAEFKIFNLIIDERIYAEFQPSAQNSHMAITIR